MNPLRSMAQKRIYARQGPEPTCPEHGAMRYTLGGWRCRWKRTLSGLVDSNGDFYSTTVFCHYKWTVDRRETEVEAWEEPDDGIRLGDNDA